MTDEEKAEEYRKANYDLTSESLMELVERCYFDGLAEGRKEKCFEQNKDGTIRPCEVMKENEQLKKDLQTAIATNRQWLKRDTRLEEQIEKMKCCENCKYGVFSDGICIDCSYDERFQPLGRCKNRSNWELAEK